ncbi:hypothetical protein Hdeb2414_s0003g00114561 [Helianthus debilis subsp. tardiflorus]
MNLDDLEKTRIGLAELLHVVGACSVTLYNMNHDEEAELALKALRFSAVIGWFLGHPHSSRVSSHQLLLTHKTPSMFDRHSKFR